MTKHELDTIIQSGEGYKTEFKSNVNSDLSKEFVAFANASGGNIFLGIEDDGTIKKGVVIDNTLKSKVTMMAHDCDPSILIELEPFDNILIVHVPEGRNKPYRCTNGFYIRNGASSIKLGTQEIIEFVQSEGRVKFDEVPNGKMKYPSQINSAAVRWFKEISGITMNMSDDELLTNLSVLDNDSSEPVINNTGVLFFATEPAKYLPQSAVVCVAYKGNNKVDILDKKTFDSDIIINIDNTLNFLKRHLNVSFEIKEKRRKEKLEIPEVVLREAVVNAIAHRDYFEKGANVMVEIFDSRIEISNPGGLPKGLKPEDFGKRTLARNPLIAALLNRARYIEKLGTGIQRMRQEMIAANLPEPGFSFDGFFTIVLKRVHTPEKAIALSLEVSAKRFKRMMYLLQQLQSLGELDIKTEAKNLGIIEKSVRQDLLLLEKKGWIVSGGTTSNRMYHLSTQAIEHFGTFKE